MSKHVQITYPKLNRTYPGKTLVRLLLVETEHTDGVVAGRDIAFGVGDTEPDALRDALRRLHDDYLSANEAVRARLKALCTDPWCAECNPTGR